MCSAACAFSESAGLLIGVVGTVRISIENAWWWGGSLEQFYQPNRNLRLSNTYGVVAVVSILLMGNNLPLLVQVCVICSNKSSLRIGIREWAKKHHCLCTALLLTLISMCIAARPGCKTCVPSRLRVPEHKGPSLSDLI